MLAVVTLEGRLTDDPELRFTPSGAAVANFTLATSERVKNKSTDEWEDGKKAFFRVAVWRQQAENVAESLKKGDLVLVTGKLYQRDYETKEGEKRTVYQNIDAYTVAAALTYATVKVTKAQRGDGGTPAAATPADDPWSSPPANSDEPPF